MAQGNGPEDFRSKANATLTTIVGKTAIGSLYITYTVVAFLAAVLFGGWALVLGLEDIVKDYSFEFKVSVGGLISLTAGVAYWAFKTNKVRRRYIVLWLLAFFSPSLYIGQIKFMEVVWFWSVTGYTLWSITSLSVGLWLGYGIYKGFHNYKTKAVNTLTQKLPISKVGQKGVGAATLASVEGQEGVNHRPKPLTNEPFKVTPTVERPLVDEKQEGSNAELTAQELRATVRPMVPPPIPQEISDQQGTRTQGSVQVGGKAGVQSGNGNDDDEGNQVEELSMP